MRKTITIARPDDWHVHLRDGDMLRTVLPYTERQFARAIVMPNLKQPVTSTALAAAYRDRIRANLQANSSFTPLMTIYLCDETSAQEVRRGFDEAVVTAVKMYPAGATTHSEYGITSTAKVGEVLEAMQAMGMPLLVHGESTDPSVDVFDREKVFIDQTLIPLLRDFPALKVVLEHITTAEAAEFVATDGSGRLAATITPQHLAFNRNAMFMGGLRPHQYCLPVLKRERHRQALRRAATSGAKSFFLGTDSAPHLRQLKEASCGCAGIFNAPTALTVYATVFEEEGALDHLEAFSSLNGPAFYGLAPNQERLTLVREPFNPPQDIALPDGSVIHPFLGGSTLDWSVRESSSETNQPEKSNDKRHPD